MTRDHAAVALAETARRVSVAWGRDRRCVVGSEEEHEAAHVDLVVALAVFDAAEPGDVRGAVESLRAILDVTDDPDNYERALIDAYNLARAALARLVTP